ncbi:hypothetical protein DCC39_12985 [Pueribacillus theae]|uniref:PepSY domain-containing protein n=1 Tax=Pueribacillus theae TaxID=2171751 RepID=A0A2U1JWB1_9BACI|nr:PepSY domain-containing protein [Pueribacillus theae]PWA09486.1 hypothetical protein DCC39_12985 [Pueribacillus theae]
MKVYSFLAGTALGLIAGLTISKQLEDKGITPEKALKKVKDELKGKLAIEGSWIQMIPEKLQNDKLEYTVYRGGLTSNEENNVTYYDFAVDTKTGAILEFKNHN